jgi:uncharacterized membrane protein
MNAKHNARTAAATLALAAALALGGCTVTKPSTGSTGSGAAGQASTTGAVSKNATEPTYDNPFMTLTADQSGTVHVDASAMSDVATFYNYVARDGTTVQLIGIRDAEGITRLALNTCQSCNPAPGAYYVQTGDALVCQNCGQQFKPENVGAAASGCNPTALTTVSRTDDGFDVSAAELEALTSKFSSWAGPTA